MNVVVDMPLNASQMSLVYGKRGVCATCICINSRLISNKQTRPTNIDICIWVLGGKRD